MLSYLERGTDFHVNVGGSHLYYYKDDRMRKESWREYINKLNDESLTKTEKMFLIKNFKHVALIPDANHVYAGYMEEFDNKENYIVYDGGHKYFRLEDYLIDCYL